MPPARPTQPPGVLDQLLRLADESRGMNRGRGSSPTAPPRFTPRPPQTRSIAENEEEGVDAQDLWMFPDEVAAGQELERFAVEALDGDVGIVDYATYEVGRRYIAGYLVVYTGPWIFGRRVLLPAGLIDRIDRADQKIFLRRTKDEIKNAPPYAGAPFTKAPYRRALERYWGPGSAGSREGTRGANGDRRRRKR
jgi:hypothetical protein